MNILRKRARYSGREPVDGEVLLSAPKLSPNIDCNPRLAGKIVNSEENSESDSEANEFAARRARNSGGKDRPEESEVRFEVESLEASSLDVQGGDIRSIDRSHNPAMNRDTSGSARNRSASLSHGGDSIRGNGNGVGRIGGGTTGGDTTNRGNGNDGDQIPMTSQAKLAGSPVPANPPDPRSSQSLESSRSTTLKPLDIDVPAEINKYVIGVRMGSGTCGVVHKALDNVLGREVAVKLSPIGEAKVSTGKVPGAQRAYQTEVHAAGRLRHPNIVTVFDAGQDRDLNYIVMEAVEGHSLKHYGKGQKLLPAHRALEVICECCKALDYSHRQAILHRDIKPANIMIGNDGSVKLLDFGIAVGLSEESGLDLTGPTLGTPNYMSPEQILSRQLTPASDFYSLGTVLFELLTGKQLFKAKKVKDLFRTVVHKRAPQLYDFRPELTRELSDVLDKALRKKPEERYQSGMEMIHALSGFIEQFRVVEDLPHDHRTLMPVLRKLPFFSSIPEADVARLVAHTELRQLSVGDDLLPDGNFGRQLLILIDGVVIAESRVGSINSDPPLRGLYGPGQCIGEYGFIHGARENVSYRATGAQQALVLSTDTLSHLAPKLHLHYYKQISDTLLRRMATEQMPFKPDIVL